MSLGRHLPRATTQDAASNLVNWRRNLVGLWIATLAAVVGATFATPFIPLFLAHDLAMHDPRELALWSGVAPAALGISLAIGSPIWGIVADRFGFKVMLLRALIGASLPIALLAVARTPIEVTLLQFGYGAFGGTVPMAIANAVKETPRKRLGFGVGVVQSAFALGQALGPFVGGLVIIWLGLRSAFLVGGGLILGAVVPVLALVRETPSESKSLRARSLSVLDAVRLAPPGTQFALAALIVAQVLSWTSAIGAQTLVALRLINVTPTSAAVATGITFGVAGIAAAIAAMSYSWAAKRFGYRRLATLAALCGAGALVAVGLAPSVGLIIATFTVFGLMRGVLIAAIPTMVGLEAPPGVVATMLGFAASALAVGAALGPLIAGTVAALTSVSAALIVAAAVSFALTLVLAVGAREPA